MKKITFILAVVAAMVSLASCNKEVAAPADAENGITATFTVNLPEQTATKAISDGTLANELLFFAYDAAGNHLDLDQTVTVSGKHASVSVNLVGGITYQFVFWAQKAGQYTAKFSSDKKTLTLDPTEMMNSDAWDAFYYKMTKAVKSSFSETVTLTRPFAQLNLGAPVKLNDSNERIGGDFWAANKSGIKIDATLQTSYKIKANNVLSLLDGTASGDTEYTLTAASHPAEFLTVGGVKYDYAAMAYLLANTTKSELTDLEITLNTEQGTAPVSLTRTVHNVPLQRNYRTNVLGNVFTLEANFDIVVDSDFTKDDNGNVVDHLPEYADIAALNAAFAKNPAEDAEKWSYKVKVLTAGDTKTIVLPKTLDPVDIHFAQGAFVGETITIAYADGAEAGDKPVKLTIEAPDPDVTDGAPSIYKLIGNLPATTVVLDGTTVVDIADFHTASNTLHLMPKAKIRNTLTVRAGSLLVEGFIETAVIDPSVAVNTVDAVAKVAEDGEVVRFVVQNLNAVIEKGAKVGTLEVSTTNDYDGAAPTVTVKGEVNEVIASTETGASVAPSVDIQDTAEVTTVEQKGDATVSISDNADVETVEAEDPSKITDEEGGAADVDFLIKNEAQLTAAVDAKVANMKIGDNFTITRGYTIGFSTDINLNGFTISADATNTSEFPNSRAFKFAGAEAMTIKVHNGEIKLLDNKIYGPFRMENSNADFVLDSLTLNNKMAYGLGIKIVDAKSIALSNSTINSVVGGCIEQCTNCPMSITNCTFNQTELDTEHPWISAGVAVSSGGSLTVESGNYSAYRALYLYSSGGTINVSGGSFVGSDAVISVDNNTWEPGYAASSVINISDGSFDGPIFVSGWGKADPAPVAALNISGGTFTNSTNNTMFHASNGTISITGGTFSEDPSAYVPEGYIVNNNGDGTWTVVEDAVAQIGTTTYGTLAKAFAAVKANEEIVVLKNCEVKTHIDVDKSPVTLNLNGFTVKNSVTSARMFDVTASNGKLTINGNGKIYIDANENVNSYGFVRLQAYGSKLILDHAELEGVTENAALLRFNNSGQSMEIKNNSKLTLTAGPNVTNKGRGTIIYNYGMNNTLSITDTDIYNYCEAPQWSAMISMENRSCTFENVRYYSETGPTGFYTGAATYTNCSIELQRTGTLNIDWSYPWLMSAVSTSSAKEVTINSGTYKGYYGIFVYSSGGAITVKGGTFEGTKAVINSENNTWEPGYAGASSINIEGGDFTGQIMAAGWGGAGTNPVAAINISGGSFKVDSSEALFTPNNASILVSGGVFSQNPTPYLKSGYKVIDNPDSNADVYPYKVVAE